MNETDTTAPTTAELDLMIKAVTSSDGRLTGPGELRDGIEAKGYAYRLQGRDVAGIMHLTQKGADLAYEAHMAREGKTIAPPFTDADALEDSALLQALQVRSGNVHAPDGARLAAQGLAWVDEERGHYFLTDDGRAAALALRDIERDLITDDMLAVIEQYGTGRARAKASGWIAGVTLYEHRVYIERVRLPHTSPHTFGSTLNVWANLRFQLFSKLGIHAEIEGDRLYFGALRPSPRGDTPQLGQRDDERDERVHAGQHADAIWSDLCDQSPGAPFRLALIEGDGPRNEYRPPVAWIFHHFSRDVRLDLDENGRYRATVTDAPDAEWATPNPPAVWTGHRADIAVKAMARALYGTKCAHGYGTGRDSCPGCDYTAELFEARYPLRGYGMRSLVLHGRQDH